MQLWLFILPGSVCSQWAWSSDGQCGCGSTPRPSPRVPTPASWLTWEAWWWVWRWAWWCCRTTSRDSRSSPCFGSSSVSTPCSCSVLSSGTSSPTACLTCDCRRHRDSLITGRQDTVPPLFLLQWRLGYLAKWVTSALMFATSLWGHQRRLTAKQGSTWHAEACAVTRITPCSAHLQNLSITCSGLDFCGMFLSSSQWHIRWQCSVDKWEASRAGTRRSSAVGLALICLVHLNPTVPSHGDISLMKVSLHSCLLKSCSAQRLLSEKFLKISVSCQHTHQKMKSKGSYKNLGLVDLVSLLEAAHA